jgi:hypothetical protein
LIVFFRSVEYDGITVITIEREFVVRVADNEQAVEWDLKMRLGFNR